MPQSNQKAVKENPLTSKDNFVVFQSALPCLIPPTNMSQAYLLNGVTENVPDIDIRYFIRSYFACHIVRIFASCIALLYTMHMRVRSILPLPQKCTSLALFGSPIGFPGDVGLTPTSFGIKEQPPINAKV